MDYIRFWVRMRASIVRQVQEKGSKRQSPKAANANIIVSTVHTDTEASMASLSFRGNKCVHYQKLSRIVISTT